MTNALEKFSGALYPVIVVALLGGAAWSLLQWISQQAGRTEVWIAPEAALSSGIASLVLSAWLMEKFIPLRALPEKRWIYRERPQRRLRSFDRESLVQIGIFTGAGTLIGTATNFPLVCGVIALLARIAPLIRGSHRLPSLLKAGRTRLIGTSSLAVQHSELVADALAANWLRWRPMRPTDNLALLFLRRLQRRSYLLVVTAVIVAATVALAGALGEVAIIMFLLAWSVLGAGFYRCADFSRIGLTSKLPIAVLFAHALLALAIVWIIWGIANPLVVIPLVIMAVIFSGYTRGRPRQVMALTAVDSGFGINISPELMNYYLKGLDLSALLIVIVAFFGV